MPFIKVSVAREYRKTGTPTEKKERRVQQLADEIFTDLFRSKKNEPLSWSRAFRQVKAISGSSQTSSKRRKTLDRAAVPGPRNHGKRVSSPAPAASSTR